MQKLVFSILLAAMTLTLYAPARDFGFVWTDQTSLVRSEHMNPPDREGVARALTSPTGNLYMPLSVVGQAIQSHFARTPEGELDPQTFHMVNIGLHTANAILVLLILSFFFKSAFPAFLGATLFAVHPLQVETVAWISAFKFLLGAFFSLVALWQYLIYARKREQQSRRSRPLPHYHVATAFFVLAMLAFPAAVVVPLMAFILERLSPKKDSLSSPQKPLWPVALWSVIAIPFAVMAISLQSTHGLSSQLSFWSKPLVAGDAVAFYINKLFVPLGVGPDYGRSPTFLLDQWWGWLSWLTPLVLAGVLLFWREKARTWFAAGTGLLVIGLLPFLGFASFESQSMSTVANRYVYLAMIGPALALTYFVSIPRKPAFFLAALAGLGAFTWATTVQLVHWKDDEALWSHALNINPMSPVAHMILADKNRVAGRMVEAKEHYQKVLEVNSVSPDPHFHLAEIERLGGRTDRAIELYAKTLELDPEYDAAHRSLGLALLKEKRPEEALKHFALAIQENPEDPVVALNQGRALLQLNRKEEAVEALERARRSRDQRVLAEAEAQLGLTLHGLGEAEKAKAHLTRALKLDTGNVQAHKILGDLLFEDEAFKEALPHYEKAVEHIQDDWALYYNLGRILLGEKRYDKAAEVFEKALALEPEKGVVMQDLAIANFNLRKFGLSIEQFKKALDLDKNLPEPHYYLGELARWSGKTEQAIGRYYLALKIDKYHSKSHYRLGQYFMKNEKPKRAVWHFNSALKNDPEDARIKGNLRRAQRAVEEEQM